MVFSAEVKGFYRSSEDDEGYGVLLWSDRWMLRRHAMTDSVVSIFELQNTRGYSVPLFRIQYQEADTGIEWQVNCGGTRGYLARFGSKLDADFDTQAADSHFMIQRIVTALLVSGSGLFEARPVGRFLFQGLEGNFTWISHLNMREPFEPAEKLDKSAPLFDWYRAICTHNVLRRALDDTYLALMYPHEAFVFIYRGFEWLRTALKLSWEDIASDVGVSVSEIKELGKMANYETGVRHASVSGEKLRADPINYGTWVCGLIDGVNAARKRLEPDIECMDATTVAEAVKKAAPITAYE